MTSIKDDNDAGLAEFLARLDWANTSEPVAFGFAVIGLTNFGERRLEITRLAEVLDMPVSEAESRARKWGGWPGTRVADGRSPSAPAVRERLPGASSRSVTAGSG